MTPETRVVIAGINGRMGRASVPIISGDQELRLVGAFGRAGAAYVSKDVSELLGSPRASGVTIENDLKSCLATCKPDVLLDFSIAEPAMEHARIAIENGIRPVIGVSGLGKESIDELERLASAKGLGAMVVPNFSVGAVLMMEFARQAGKHFSNVEIVEMHHTRKLDAPSGTSMHTMGKLAEHGRTYNAREVQEKEILPGARGAWHESGVRVHSLRLPGLISHQDVIFGSDGELLSIRHDSFNTNCFIKGILMSIKAVMQMKSLVVGLESLL